MKKTEIFAFGILLFIYLNKVLNLIEFSGFTFFNSIAFFILSVFGYSFYKQPNYIDEKRATNFAVYCGISFSFGIIAFGAKVWNHSNTVVLVLAIPNFMLFSFLLYNIIERRKNDLLEKSVFYQDLLIRSSIILIITIVMVFVPTYLLNQHLNKEEPILHNRGLAEVYLIKTKELSSQENFEDALSFAKKSLKSSKIGWNDNMYFRPNEALYLAYIGLINKAYLNDNENKILKYAKSVRKPMQFCYGDSSYHEALVNIYVGKVYQDRGNYKRADSIFLASIDILNSCYKTENLWHVNATNHLACSYRDQGYLLDAEELFKASIKYLEKDVMLYTNPSDPSKVKELIPNWKSSTHAEMAWNYVLQQQSEKASLFFEKAFNTTTFKNQDDYLTALIRYTSFSLANGDFFKAKTLIKDAMKIAYETFGEKSFDYIEALGLLNTININLANYKEAEKGCLKAISLYEKLSTEKGDYKASLIYSLGLVKYHQASYSSAKKLFIKSLKYTEKESLRHADILGSLSMLNGNLSKFSIAISQVRTSSRIAEQYLGNNSAFLTEYLRNEAYVNYLDGNIKEANKLYTRCFTLDTLHNNQKKISFASTLNGIGLVKSQKQQFIKADSLFKESLDIYKIKIGEMHPSYATVLTNIAYLRLKQENFEDSERLFKQSINIIKNVLSDKHDMIADNLICLGKLKSKNHKFKEALNYFKEAIIIYKNKFGEENQKVVLLEESIKYCKKRLE